MGQTRDLGEPPRARRRGLFSRAGGTSGLTPPPGGVDLNGPHAQLLPIWGPDAYSRRMVQINALRANPASPASIGIGVMPAPPGSQVQRTKTDEWLPQPQQFRGYVKTIIDPSSGFLVSVGSFPATSVAVDPVLFAMSAQAPGVQ